MVIIVRIIDESRADMPGNELIMSEKDGVNSMNLESLTKKQLNELERCVQELLSVMRKTRISDEALVEPLKVLEEKLGEVRRERFDETNPEYRGY